MEEKKNLKTVEFTAEPKNPNSPTISSIDVQAEFKMPSPREQFLDDYTFCPLCGDELLYTHNTHFVSQSVAEEAHCSSCNIRTKSNQHRLQ